DTLNGAFDRCGYVAFDSARGSTGPEGGDTNFGELDYGHPFEWHLECHPDPCYKYCNSPRKDGHRAAKPPIEPIRFLTGLVVHQEDNPTCSLSRHSYVPAFLVTMPFFRMATATISGQ